MFGRYEKLYDKINKHIPKFGAMTIGPLSLFS